MYPSQYDVWESVVTCLRRFTTRVFRRSDALYSACLTDAALWGPSSARDWGRGLWLMLTRLCLRPFIFHHPLAVAHGGHRPFGTRGSVGQSTTP